MNLKSNLLPFAHWLADRLLVYQVPFMLPIISCEIELLVYTASILYTRPTNSCELYLSVYYTTPTNFREIYPFVHRASFLVAAAGRATLEETFGIRGYGIRNTGYGPS